MKRIMTTRSRSAAVHAHGRVQVTEQSGRVREFKVVGLVPLVLTARGGATSLYDAIYPRNGAPTPALVSLELDTLGGEKL